MHQNVKSPALWLTNTAHRRSSIFTRRLNADTSHARSKTDHRRALVPGITTKRIAVFTIIVDVEVTGFANTTMMLRSPSRKVSFRGGLRKKLQSEATELRSRPQRREVRSGAGSRMDTWAMTTVFLGIAVPARAELRPEHAVSQVAVKALIKPLARKPVQRENLPNVIERYGPAREQHLWFRGRHFQASRTITRVADDLPARSRGEISREDARHLLGETVQGMKYGGRPGNLDAHPRVAVAEVKSGRLLSATSLIMSHGRRPFAEVKHGKAFPTTTQPVFNNRICLAGWQGSWNWVRETAAGRCLLNNHLPCMPKVAEVV